MKHASVRRSGVATAMVALPLVGGCIDDSGGDTWSFSSESLPGGRVQVVNTPPASATAPTWMIEEELRIGSIDEESPTTFGQLKGLVVLDDGRIVVLDAQAQELRLFSADGAHLTTHGNRGGGPGEFEGAFGLMRDASGSLWVPDHANQRMSVLDPDSGFERSMPLVLPSFSLVWNGSIRHDGCIVWPSITSTEGRGRILHVWDSAFNPIDELPLPEPGGFDPEDPPGAFVWTFPGGRRGAVEVPFYPGRLEVFDVTGVVWSRDAGDPSYRIKQWTPGGDTALVIETRRAPVQVFPAERDSAIQSVREILGSFGTGDRDWGKIPDLKPAVTSMFLSEEGQLWVQTPAASGYAASGYIEYDVYDRDGRRVGTAATSLPIWRYLSPVVRGDRFWAVVHDDLGVPYVVRARIAPVESMPD